MENILNFPSKKLFLFKTFCHGHDCFHDLHLKLRTLTGYSKVFANIENPEDWHSQQTFQPSCMCVSGVASKYKSTLIHGPSVWLCHQIRVLWTKSCISKIWHVLLVMIGQNWWEVKQKLFSKRIKLIQIIYNLKIQYIQNIAKLLL